MKHTYKQGFTLIEVIVIMAILAILFTMVIAAINPLRQIGQANNAKRQSDITTLINAIYQFSANHNGTFPPQITAIEQDISSSGSDICLSLVPEYLAGLPQDPHVSLNTNIQNCASLYNTGYRIKLSGSDFTRVTISAPSAQNGEIISITE